MNRFPIHKIVLLLFVLVSAAPRISSANYSVDLTEEERQWLKTCKPIRVSNVHDWVPFTFNENGKPMGFSIDYMNNIGKILGIEIEYISGPEFGEYLVMAKNREIDVLIPLAYVEERTSYLNFTTSFVRNINAIVSRTDNGYSSLQQLTGKTVAVTEGTFHHKLLETEYPDVEIRLYPAYQEAVLAVSMGEVDAAVGGQSAASYFIREYFLTNLSISGVIPLKNPALEELCIGVRDDWPLLSSSIQKAMNAFPPEEYEKIQNRWLGTETEISVHSTQTDLEFIRIIVAIFIGIVIISVVGLWAVKKLNLDISKLKWRNILTTSLIALAIFVGIVVFIASLSLKRIERNFEEDITFSLGFALDTTDQTLISWIDTALGMLTRYIQNPDFQILVENLLKNEEYSESAQRALGQHLAETFQWPNEGACLVIDRDFIVVASNDTNEVGFAPVFLEQGRIELIQAFGGRPSFVTPVEVYVPKNRPISQGYFLAPIYNRQGQVIALLAAPYYPSRNFRGLMHNYGKSGETYAFDKSGVMISESRFTEQLLKNGIIDSGTTSILKVKIRDPENQEFTKMAESALMRIDGWSTKEYRNYRGIPVLGIWLWNEDYGYGLAVEIEAAEALERYNLVRRIIILILAFTVLLAVVTTLLSLVFSGKANEALNASNADLKKRVRKRTKELSATNKLFKSAIEAVTNPFYIIDAATYEIVLANQAATDMASSLGNIDAKTCEDFLFGNQMSCTNSKHKTSLENVVKTKETIVIEQIYKDQVGRERYYEIHDYPIVNKNGDVVRIIESVFDITGRKLTDKRIKEHLDELKLFNKLTIGREERMIELKSEINELLQEMDLPEKYIIVPDDEEYSPLPD